MPSLKILVFFVFNTNLISKSKIKSWKHSTKTVEIHLPLDVHNASAVAEIILRKPP